MPSIEYSNTNRQLVSIIEDIENEVIRIPPHQRDFVWSKRQQVKLVDAIEVGMPMPNITLRNRRVGQVTSITLEDGQQRLTTLRRFMTNMFPDSRGRHFSELSETEQVCFRKYMVNVMTYSNATDEQAIEIFNSLQNGSQCSVGERVYSLSKISPLVQFAVDMLLTPGMGFYERTVPFWGERTPKGQRGTYMVTAFALCAGLALGSKYYSKRWVDIEDAVSKPFNRNQLMSDLETIVSIYEYVHAQHPTPGSMKKFYWDLGNITGYIAHSLRLLIDVPQGRTLPTREVTIQTWKDFIIRQRNERDILDSILRRDVEFYGRAWTERRWDMGWRRLFAPDTIADIPRNRDVYDEEYDSEETDA